MQSSTRRRQTWRRRLALLLAAMAVGLGGITLAPPVPAHAATHITYCFPIWKQIFHGYWIKYWACFDVPFAYNPSLVPDYAIGVITEPELPLDIQQSYLGATVTGLDLLGQAGRATDPGTAGALRARAQDSFLAAARHLAGAHPRLGLVGIADVRELRIDPSSLPWLESAGVDIADGLLDMQRALADRQPDPWVRAAMTEFEAAYQQLAAPPRG